jgi:hypothetical protein
VNMGVHRKFAIKTSWINLPRGTSPADPDGVKLAETLIKQMLGAEDVSVSFDASPDGTPLLEQMKVHAELPAVWGGYVSTAALEKDQAKLLGEVINALAGGGDATGPLNKLLQSAKGGSPDGEGDDSGAGDEEKPKGVPSSEENKLTPASPSLDALPSGAGGPANAPSSNKPRIGFANKKLTREQRRVRAQRMAAIQRELGIDFRSASQIMKIVETSPRFSIAHNKLAQLVVDENENPLAEEEYIHITKVARGEEAPLA